jgi:hypothetical protein
MVTPLSPAAPGPKMGGPYSIQTLKRQLQRRSVCKGRTASIVGALLPCRGGNVTAASLGLRNLVVKREEYSHGYRTTNS